MCLYKVLYGVICVASIYGIIVRFLYLPLGRCKELEALRERIKAQIAAKKAQIAMSAERYLDM